MSDWFTDKCFRIQYTINRARGVFYNGKTYAVFQGPDSDPRIMAFDHNADSWSLDHQVGESIISNNDDHGNPGMCVDSNGRIHVIYGGHGLTSGEMRHRVSTDPEDITRWRDGGAIPEKIATYPSLFTLDNGNLIYIYRGRNHAGGVNSHKADWYCTVSTDNGESWSSPTAILRGTEDKRPDDTWYIYAHAKGPELHVAFTFHQCGDGPHPPTRFNAYYVKRTATGDWVNAAGRVFGLPITRAVADNPANQIIVHSFSENTMWCAVDVNDSGTPFLSISMIQGNGTRKYCANWTGSSWRLQPVAFHSGADRQYTKTVIFHRDGELKLFCFGNNGRDLLEYRSFDNNQNWSVPTTVFSGDVGDPCVVWQPHEDAYLFFTDEVSATIRNGYIYGDSGLVGTEGLGASTGIFECENLSLSASDDTQLIAMSAASGGKFIRLAANAVGDWIEFLVNFPPGEYGIVLRGRTGGGRGRYKLAIDGVDQGPVIDQFQSVANFRTWDFGTKTFSSSGPYTFRFECVGKSASSNGFSGSFDFIRIDGASTIYECENLDITASDDTQLINMSGASNGQFIRLVSNAVGDWIEFSINPPVGTYTIVLRGRTGGGRGQYQLSIDGENQGPVIDQYQSVATFTTWDLGPRTFDTQGHRTFRFDCVGQSASSNGYVGSFDYILLEK